MVYPILGRIIPPITYLFLEKIEGLENLPKKGAFILAANHASYLDHLILGSIIKKTLDRKIIFLAKKEHFEHFFSRLWHKHFSAIPIDRQAGGKKALKEALKCLREGKIIGIYPEGTRTLTGKIQAGKTGVARLSLWAKVPVVPVGITGSFQILPKGKTIPRFGKKAKVRIGKKMLFPKHYGKQNHRVLTEVTKSIMRQIASLSDQKYVF